MKAPSTFKQSLSVTLPSFVNKCGAIGLDLVPMLLVAKSVGASQSALVMTVIKAMSFAGAFIGGALSDFWGFRPTYLISFIASGIGMTLLPFTESLWFIAAFAGVAQMGNSMYQSTARFVVFDLLPKSKRHEGIGWMRTANNFGQIFSNLIANLAAGLGFSVLMLFDASTSFIAAALGFTLFPRNKIPSKDQGLEHSESAKIDHSHDRQLFALIAVISGFYSVIYGIFITSAPARAQLHFGSHGLAVFTQAMLINVVLCGGLAVVTSRKIKKPGVALGLGALLNGSGMLVMLSTSTTLWIYYLGIFILSLGEVFFYSMMPFLLAELTPETKFKGSTFSLGIVIQNLGRAIGAALAFPTAVYGVVAKQVTVVMTAIVLMLVLWFIRVSKKRLAGVFD
jgi:MFS family permease